MTTRWIGSLLLVLVTLVAARADDPPAVGESRWIAGHWWLHLGRDERGRDLWLYPHLDGVPEVFAAPRRGAGTWTGSLGSRFDPARQAFDARFNAAEALNAWHDAAGARARRAAARLLGVFLALHPAPEPPVYLRDVAGELAATLTADDVAEVHAVVATHRALIARVRTPSPRALERPRDLLTADDHLAALIEDGYLDVVVVGGNSKDPETGERHSGDLLGDLAGALERQGFTPAAFGRGGERALRERAVVLLGRPVRVRVLLAGGSARDDRVRRAVAAFVEGLAFADVFLYLGHSNGDTGRYHLSEAKAPEASFHLGADGDDLARRCHLLGRRPHQVIVLHSCSSWPKYARPLAAFCAAQPGAVVPGLVGTAAPAYFDEFVPRYATLLDLLTRGAGPRALAQALREAPRRPDAAPLVLRGVLQPRHTFVVPEGVEVTRIDEAEDPPVGVGSDGVRYPSTEAFPQDRPGDVVQVVRWREGLVGLRRDGRLLRVGPETGGECVEASPRHLLLRRVLGDGERLIVVDAAGRAHVGTERGLVPLRGQVAGGVDTPSLLDPAAPAAWWVGTRRVRLDLAWEVHDPFLSTVTPTPR